jgi:RNA-dependent RNA polymerase
VDKEELRYLYNVVVFSTKGDRPDQNKLSMGDLDGDTYMVLWDKDIVNEFKENH